MRRSRSRGPTPRLEGCFNCGLSDHISRDCPYRAPSSSLSCYVCKGPHLMRDCPEAMSGLRCFRCGSLGHFARECGASRAGGVSLDRAAILNAVSNLLDAIGASPDDIPGSRFPAAPSSPSTPRESSRDSNFDICAVHHRRRLKYYLQYDEVRGAHVCRESSMCTERYGVPLDVNLCNKCGGRGHYSKICPSLDRDSTF